MKLSILKYFFMFFADVGTSSFVMSGAGFV